MKKDIFEYKDYKSYLNAYIKIQPKGGRGLRLSMAKFIGSPVSHISQILNGSSHLSLEQAEGMNEYIGHTHDESSFFLLLVQLARAGTPALKKRWNQQIQLVLEKRLILKERLGITQNLTHEEQMKFYSSWIYGAVHVMLTIPEFQKKENISHYLGISIKRTSEILEFLTSVGLARKKENGDFEVGTARIHLGADSPLISKFHTNWRIRAIDSFDVEDAIEDLHYSSVITIAHEDRIKIKSYLIKCIEEIKSIIRESPAEGLHSFNIDFFRL